MKTRPRIQEIKVEEIKNYSFEELLNANYSNPDYKRKLKEYSDYELLGVFRKRSFPGILLKIFSLDLEQGLSIPPRRNEEVVRNGFLIEAFREVMIFPANPNQVRILKSDPASYRRIVKFMEKNSFTRQQVPEVLMRYFLNLNIGEIHWQESDEQFMQHCRGEASASSYNAGAGRLALLQRAIENGVSVKMEKETINSSEAFERWMSKNYPTFLKLVRKRNQIKIIEK